MELQVPSPPAPESVTKQTSHAQIYTISVQLAMLIKSPHSLPALTNEDSYNNI